MKPRGLFLARKVEERIMPRIDNSSVKSSALIQDSQKATPSLKTRRREIHKMAMEDN